MSLETTGSSGSNGFRGEEILISPRVTEYTLPGLTENRPNPALGWCFTWCNYPEDWKEILVPGFQDCEWVAGYIVGREIAPSTGTPHLQGYLRFAKGHKARPMGLLPKTVHWIAAKGDIAANVAYCSKEDEEPLIHGVCVTAKRQRYTISIDLRLWQIEIDAICRTQPHNRTIYWYWEPNGCKGKTTFQKWLFLNHKGVIVVSGKASDMKNGVIEYEEKHSVLPSIVLINIPRCTDTDHVSWQGIEEIKDMFFFSPKYHGGQVCGPNPHVFIFSNEEPPMYKLSQDRWRVVQIPS